MDDGHAAGVSAGQRHPADARQQPCGTGDRLRAGARRDACFRRLRQRRRCCRRRRRNLSASQIQEADGQAQTQTRTAQTAIETYSTDHDGQYAGASADALKQIEPTLADAPLSVEAQPDGYTVTVESESGTNFSIVRDPAGTTILSCDAPGVGNCPDSGDWATQ